MFYNIPNLDKLVELHNYIRAKESFFYKPLLKLNANKKLFQYAQNWAEHIAQIDTLMHSDIKKIISLGFSIAAENISSVYQTETEVITQWMKSNKHKKNIYHSKYDSIGCGFAYSDGGKPYWVVCFGATVDR